MCLHVSSIGKTVETCTVSEISSDDSKFIREGYSNKTA